MALFKKKIKGLIQSYELTEFWLNQLTATEQKFIKNNYGVGSIGLDPDMLLNGNWTLSLSKLNFLTGLLSMVSKPELNVLGIKIIKEADRNINETTNGVDIHLYISAKIHFYYKNRDINNNLENAIIACEEQIKFAKTAIKAFKDEYEDENVYLPGHLGYKQLAIIKEKQIRFEEAISLCKEAKEQGWNDDWEHRLERLTNKLNKSIKD